MTRAASRVQPLRAPDACAARQPRLRARWLARRAMRRGARPRRAVRRPRVRARIDAAARSCARRRGRSSHLRASVSVSTAPRRRTRHAQPACDAARRTRSSHAQSTAARTRTSCTDRERTRSPRRARTGCSRPVATRSAAVALEQRIGAPFAGSPLTLVRNGRCTCRVPPARHVALHGRPPSRHAERRASRAQLRRRGRRASHAVPPRRAVARSPSTCCARSTGASSRSASARGRS